jgi:hypothetical protein
MTLPGQERNTRFLSFARLTAFSLLAGCASVPPPDGTPSFGVLGDVPYSDAEVERLDLVIDEMNREQLAFVVHVGDIGTRPPACTDEWIFEVKTQLARIRHPFVLVPGDNEWSECRDPLARLQRWRETFCYTETIFRLTRQQGEYCEHLRWEAGGRVFITLNLPGNDNNAAARAEHAARMKAVFEWLDEAVKLAESRKGLVILIQANPFIGRGGFDAFNQRLEMLGRRMPGKVMLIHGDTHIQRDDEPFPGVRRVEVWGSPFVTWTRLPL